MRHRRPLAALYETMLDFVRAHCTTLLDLTTGPGAVQGFDFLVQAVWPELVAAIDQSLGEIFLLGIADKFHEVVRRWPARSPAPRPAAHTVLRRTWPCPPGDRTTRPHWP